RPGDLEAVRAEPAETIGLRNGGLERWPDGFGQPAFSEGICFASGIGIMKEVVHFLLIAFLAASVVGVGSTGRARRGRGEVARAAGLRESRRVYGNGGGEHTGAAGLQ